VVWDGASIAPESMEPATGLMTAEEAEEVLRRLVALPGGSRLIVSMADLAARIASWG